MNEKEKKLLNNLSRLLGNPEVSESAFKQIEEAAAKKEKERKLLEQFENALLGIQIKPTEKQNETLHNSLVDSMEEFVEPIVVEDTFADIKNANSREVTVPNSQATPVQPQPVLPDSFVNKVTDTITKTAKKSEGPEVVKVDPVRAEIQQMKQSITDLHSFASRMSQMGGGGEVNLRYLDDIDKSTFVNNYFLSYSSSTNNFLFANVTTAVDWLHIPSSINPDVSLAHSLGNNTNRWESLWVGSNSITFSDTLGGPDQVLSLANQVFYITQGSGSNTTFNANAGFNAGGVILQNYTIRLADAQHDFTIGSPGDGGRIIIQRTLDIGNSVANAAVSAFEVANNGLTTIRNNLQIINPITQTNAAPFTIQSQLGTPQGFTDPGVTMYAINSANVSNRLVMDTYGNGVYNSIAGRTSRGTISAPTSLASNDVILRISGNGYDGAGFPSTGTARIDFVTAENFSVANQGSSLRFWTTPLGTNTVTVTMLMTSNATTVNGAFTANNTYVYGDLSVTGNTTSNNATFSGNVAIYGTTSANNINLQANAGITFPDNTTQITAYKAPNVRIDAAISNTVLIDFASDNIIYVHTNGATLTANIQNLSSGAGRSIELFIFNNIGGTQQFNHNLRSGTQATGGQSFYLCTHNLMYVKYFCLDGNTYNTFVTAIV